MRIAFTSDIHADITAENQKLLPYLAEEFSRLDPDAIVLAGDIANSLSGWKGALSHFNEINVPKFIIPGNHDVWVESKNALKRGQDSGWKYRIALPECARDFGFHYLPGQPFVLSDVGFAGSLGWYDYSLRDERLDGVLSRFDYERGELKKARGMTFVMRPGCEIRIPRIGDDDAHGSTTSRFVKICDTNLAATSSRSPIVFLNLSWQFTPLQLNAHWKEVPFQIHSRRMRVR